MGYSRSLPGPVGAQTSRHGPKMAPQSLPGGALVPVREVSQACLRGFAEDVDANSRIGRIVLGVEAGILP